MLRYTVKLEREGKYVLASFPDAPGVHTFGKDHTEALARAADALETMFMALIEDRKSIPAPGPVRRGSHVTLPALTEAKLALYREMRSQDVGKAELARRMNCHPPQIDRLLDLSHASRLDQLEAAFGALNKRMSIEVYEAA
jgi:antitoxin HicB